MPLSQLTLVDSAQLDADLEDVADAIRAKSGGSSPLAFPAGFISEIGSISVPTLDTLTATDNGTYTPQSGHAYDEVVVNVPKGITPTGTKQISITANGTTTEDVTNYASAEIAVNVSGGGAVGEDPKDVNFLDYDGTILYSYSASDFANLAAMPANPSHAGLTAQGWNWTLADAKAQVSAAGYLDIGQMYVTDDGKTRVYIHVEEERKSISVGLAVNGTVTVDWGDGSAVDTITGTSATAVKYSTEHSYAAAGDYVIAISSSGSYTLLGSTNGSYLISKPGGGSLQALLDYTKKVELGSSVRLYNFAFAKAMCLDSITIPKDTAIDGNNVFNTCRHIKSVTIPSRSDSANISLAASFFSGCYAHYISLPKKAVSYGDGVFYQCYCLTRTSIPDDATTLGSGIFNGCNAIYRANIPSGAASVPTNYLNSAWSVLSVVVPSSVTSIASAVFYHCYSLKEIHFLSATPPAVANSNAFNGLPTDCIIYVPTGTLSAYTSASNYPSSSTYTYVEE